MCLILLQSYKVLAPCHFLCLVWNGWDQEPATILPWSAMPLCLLHLVACIKTSALRLVLLFHWLTWLSKESPRRLFFIVSFNLYIAYYLMISFCSRSKSWLNSLGCQISSRRAEQIRRLLSNFLAPAWFRARNRPYWTLEDRKKKRTLNWQQVEIAKDEEVGWAWALKIQINWPYKKDLVDIQLLISFPCQCQLFELVQTLRFASNFRQWLKVTKLKSCFSALPSLSSGPRCSALLHWRWVSEHRCGAN